MASAVTTPKISAIAASTDWHEILGSDGSPRPAYKHLLGEFDRLRPADLRSLDDRMAATLREMGVNFDIIRNDP